MFSLYQLFLLCQIQIGNCKTILVVCICLIILLRNNCKHRYYLELFLLYELCTVEPIKMITANKRPILSNAHIKVNHHRIIL